MKILAIDSSAKVASAALCEDEALIGLTTLNTGNTHSETLLLSVDELLKKAGIENSQIDIFACSNGPGSFTGVRIGVSIIKGLAFGRGRCCAGVSTLHALAMNIDDREGIISPVMDAKRSQLYNALFECDGKTLRRLTPDRVITANELRSELSSYERPIYFCGDGCDVAHSEIQLENIKKVNLFSEYQSAFSVARLALEAYRTGSLVNDLELLPVYLRASQAERERIRRESEK